MSQTNHTLQSWINGKPCRTVEITERGLLYGDAFFTTIRISNGKVEHWPLHAERLAISADRLAFPVLDIDAIHSELEQFVQFQLDQTAAQEAIVRLTISRGRGVRGYRAPDSPQLQRILSWTPMNAETDFSQGVRLAICQTQASINPQLAGIKHTNRLPEVLAASEIGQDCFDGLMRAGDQLISGTKCNLYCFIDGRWHTPILNQAGVNGTVRRWLLANQPDFVESELTLVAIESARYCLVSNAIVGIIPVKAIGSTEFELFPDWLKLNQAYRQSAYML